MTAAENGIAAWRVKVEVALAREERAERMTREEAELLRRRLEYLAFNIVTHGAGERQKISASRRRAGTRRALSDRQRARADKWWELGAQAGLLHVTEREVAFHDRDEMEYFLLRYCQTRGLDGWLLRHASAPAFARVWWQWAREKPGVTSELIALARGAKDARTRAKALTILGYVGERWALDAIMAALEDSSDAARVAAAGAAARYSDPEIMERLADVIASERDWMRVMLSEAIGQAGGDAAVPALSRLLRHKVWLVGRAAIAGLSRTNSERAVEALKELLDHPATESGDWILPDWMAQEALAALARMGEVAIPALTKALNDERWQIRSAAEQALRWLIREAKRSQ